MSGEACLWTHDPWGEAPTGLSQQTMGEHSKAAETLHLSLGPNTREIYSRSSISTGVQWGLGENSLVPVCGSSVVSTLPAPMVHIK